MTQYFLSPLLHIPAPQSPPQMHNSTHHMVPCSATGGQFITVTLSFCREHKASERLFRVLPATVLSTRSISDIKYTDQHRPVNFLNKGFLNVIYFALSDIHSTSAESIFLIAATSTAVLSKRNLHQPGHPLTRGELSYLAPLGSEKISAPYFNQCFFRGGVLPPQTESNTTPPSPKTEITNILFYILNLWLRIYCSGLRGRDTREKEIVI